MAQRDIFDEFTDGEEQALEQQIQSADALPDADNHPMVGEGGGQDQGEPKDAGEQAKQGGEQTEPQKGESEANKAQPEKAPESPPPGYVPHQALYESRQINKELRDQLAETQRKLGQFESLREELNELRKGQNTQAEEARKQDLEKMFDEDPIEALRLQNKQLEEQVKRMAEQDEQVKTQSKQQQEQVDQMRQVQAEIRRQANEFTQQQPDYPKAFMFLMERRMQDYQALGITDPQEAQQNFDMEVMSLAHNAMQRGMNPAQAAYNLAKNWGYTAEQQPEKEPDAGNKAGDGNSLDEQLDRLEKGKRAEKSLSGGGGRAPEGDLSLTDIEQMSDEEFDKLWNEMENSSIYE